MLVRQKRLIQSLRGYLPLAIPSRQREWQVQSRSLSRPRIANVEYFL